jgi:hypothetical protein
MIKFRVYIGFSLFFLLCVLIGGSLEIAVMFSYDFGSNFINRAVRFSPAFFSLLALLFFYLAARTNNREIEARKFKQE